MKNKIISFLISRSGTIIKPLIAAGLGYLAIYLYTNFKYTITPETVTALAVGITGFIVAVLDTTFLAPVGDGVKKIQKTVDEVQDGVPGVVTQAAVKDAVTFAKRPTNFKGGN